jgi:hypothetical protein
MGKHCAFGTRGNEIHTQTEEESRKIYVASQVLHENVLIGGIHWARFR